MNNNMQMNNVSLHRNKFLLDAIWYYFGQRWSTMELQRKSIERVLTKLRMLSIRKKSLRRIKKCLRHVQRRRYRDGGFGWDATKWYGRPLAEHVCKTHKVSALLPHVWNWFHDMACSATDVAVLSIAWLLKHQNGSVDTADDRLSMFKHALLPAMMQIPQDQRRDAIIAKQSQILFYDMTIDERQDLIDTMMFDTHRLDLRGMGNSVLQTVQNSYEAHQNALQWGATTSMQAQAKEQTMGQLLLFDIQKQSGKTMLRKTGLNPTQSLECTVREVAAMGEKEEQAVNRGLGYQASMGASMVTPFSAHRSSPVMSQAIRKQCVQSPTLHETVLKKNDVRKNMQASEMGGKAAIDASHLSTHPKHRVVANKGSFVHRGAAKKSGADIHPRQPTRRLAKSMTQALIQRLNHQALHARRSLHRRVRSVSTCPSVSSASLLQRAVAWNGDRNQSVVVRGSKMATAPGWPVPHSMFFHAKSIAYGVSQTPFNRARVGMERATVKQSLLHRSFASRGSSLSFFDDQENSVSVYRQKAG